MGRTARRAAAAVRALGAGLAARRGEAGPVAVPVGAWRDDDRPGLDPIVLANPALAAYAAQLRAKRGVVAAPRRGLPLVTRRERSAVGTATTPGGLARAAVPTDRPEDPDVTSLVSTRRTPTTPTGAPTARRSR
jgi:hypothetical protein